MTPKNQSSLQTIPLLTATPEGLPAGGTGFLGLFHGHTWLVTAAHVILGANPVHGRWIEWPEFATLKPFGNHNVVDMPLFRGSGSNRDPKFAFRGATDSIADFLALPVPPHAFVAIPELAAVEAFDLNDVAELSPGDALEIVGYPTDVDEWPVVPAFRRTANVLSTAYEHFEFTPASVNGTSGGPILASNGRLGGLVMGDNYGIGRAVAATAIPVIIAANFEQRGDFTN